MLHKITQLKNHITSTANSTKNENGFTLIEIMSVILIIGLLAGIAIPIVSTQQKSSMEASVKADLRNAGLVMRTESTKNKGRMLSYLPSFATQSPDNQITLDSTRSNEYYYCLVGSNINLSTMYYYSSYVGKITTTPCPVLTGGGAGGGGGTTPGAGGGTTPGTPNLGPSFDEKRAQELAPEKALVVYRDSVSSALYTESRNFVSGYGYGLVDLAEASIFASWSTDKINSYDLIVFQGAAWATPENLRPKIDAYYNQGGLILQTGNDTNETHSPFITGSVRATNSGATYDPTYKQGLSPVFPYTFEATGFGSDSNWFCVTETVAGAVTVAVTNYSNVQCITLFGIANANGGRYIYATSLTNGISQPIRSSFEWLLS